MEEYLHLRFWGGGLSLGGLIFIFLFFCFLGGVSYRNFAVCKNGIEFFGEINRHSLNRTIRGQFRPKSESCEIRFVLIAWRKI